MHTMSSSSSSSVARIASTRDIDMESALRHLQRDTVLNRVMKSVSIEFDIKPSRNRYRSIIEAIITQQLSGSSAGAISKRFRSMYDKPYPRPSDVAATPHARLKATGLSVRKAYCIREISQMIDSGQIPLDKTCRMQDDQIMQMLTEVKGIGRWTVEIFLMFGLGRPDVLPVGDLGLRKGVKIFYGLSEMPSEDQVEKIAEAWRPYRSIATWYIWKAQ